MKSPLHLKVLVATLFVTLGLSAQSSLNVTLADQLPMVAGHTLANICGYTAPNGNEYALLGDATGMIIVDVTVPTNVVQIVQIPLVNNLWKEIKVYQNYAYVTTEGGGGLQIIDLTAIPATNPASYTYHNYTGDGVIAGQINNIHALHIDTTAGYCYLFGSNLFSGGAVILNLNVDPYNPTYAGKYDANGYVHDGYVDNDTLYAAHVYAGKFTIVDCTNKTAPVVLGQQITPTAFTHNVWLSADRNILFTTDENANAFLAAYDVSDPQNITELDRTQSWNPNSGSISHNTQVVGLNWTVTSWYVDGFVITDITRPGNLVNVGWYDTYSGTGTGYAGDWGVFPYFPSGTIVASNINEGLYVCSPTYVRACYLEGMVYDSLCGFPLPGATITVSTVNLTETADITGSYAMGTAIPGSYTVTYSAPGYQTVVMNNVVFAAGQLNLFNVGLIPVGGFAVSGHVEDAVTTAALPAIAVEVSNLSNQYAFVSDGSGDFYNCVGVTGLYDIYAAAWSYNAFCAQDSVTQTSGLIDVQLNVGYEDHFTFDLGWIETGNSTTGVWTRGEPIGTTFSTTNDANPDSDVSNDCSDKCYVTGNGGGSASNDDVDDGNTVLTSPVMNLSTYGDPYVEYSRWFFNSGTNLDDTLYIRVSNGTTTVTLEQVDASSLNNSSWVDKSYRLQNYITVTSTMRMIIEISDQNSSDDIVEAGFDNFAIVDSNALATHTPNVVENGMSVYPNPFNGATQVNYSVPSTQVGSAYIEVIDMTGRIVSVSSLTNATGAIVLGSDLADGVYMIRLMGSDGLLDQTKIVKSE